VETTPDCNMTNRGKPMNCKGIDEQTEAECRLCRQ